MISEERVMALLEEGDPATRVEDEVWKDMDASAYLSSLRIGRSPDLDELRDRRQRPTKGRRVAAVAAVVTLLAGLAVVLLARSNEAPPAATNPPTPSTLLPTPTTVPAEPGASLERFWKGTRMTIHLGDGEYQIIEDDAVTDHGIYDFREPGRLTLITTGDTARCSAGDAGEYMVEMGDGSLLLVPVEDDCVARGISRTGSSFEVTDPFEVPESALSETRAWSATASSPGLYTTTVFQPTVTFVLPPRWRSPAPDVEFNFGMERPPGWMVFNTQGSESLSERVGGLEGDVAINVIETNSVSVGGKEAVRLDFTVSSEVTLILTTGLTGVATPDEKVRAWIVDVDGAIVSIFFGSTRANFDSMAEDAQTIIDSIVWG